MAKLASTLVGLLFSAVALGCDSSAELDACPYSDTPEADPGSRGRCLRSTFAAESVRGREVAGTVWRGEQVVPGALVRITPWDGFPAGESAGVASTTTDAAGFFGGLRPAGLRYDLAVAFGADASGTADVLAYRGVGFRWVEPSIEVAPRAAPRSWSGRFDVQLEAKLPDGQALAFFASGDGVFGVSGEASTGLSVATRDYTARATIHAIAYERGADLSTAKAYGKADVVSDAGVRRIASLRLEPISVFVEPRFVVTAPPGFSPSTIDVVIGYSRTSDARLATVPLGAAARLPVVPNAQYMVHVRAEHGGAVSDSGDVGFDAYAKEIAIDLPRPPTTDSPGAGEALGPGERLVAGGRGVLEHVLVPEGPGASRPRLRVIAGDLAAAPPDLEQLGLAPARGRYSWTVRSFPSARFAEELTGPAARRFRPMAASPPRIIELR